MVYESDSRNRWTTQTRVATRSVVEKYQSICSVSVSNVLIPYETVHCMIMYLKKAALGFVSLTNSEQSPNLMICVGHPVAVRCKQRTHLYI